MGAPVNIETEDLTEAGIAVPGNVSEGPIHGKLSRKCSYFQTGCDYKRAMEIIPVLDAFSGRLQQTSESPASPQEEK
jgi:hypothetical protein